MLQFDIVICLLIDGGKEAKAFHHHHHRAAPEPWSHTALSRALCRLVRQSKTQPAFPECNHSAGKVPTNADQARWINFAAPQPR